MKLYIFIILIILFISYVESQKYISFKGGYYSSDCSGDELGGGEFLFSNGVCVDSVPGYESYLFKIENSTTVLATEYTTSSTCPTHESGPTQSFTVGCSLKPSFVYYPDAGKYGAYSIVSFSNVPTYTSNSIVIEQYSDSSCKILSNAVTYDNGFQYEVNFSTKQYECVNGIAKIITCYDGCTTEVISTKCGDNGNSTIFCS